VAALRRTASDLSDLSDLSDSLEVENEQEIE